MSKTCPICFKEFYPTTKNSKYCSPKCKYKASNSSRNMGIVKLKEEQIQRLEKQLKTSNNLADHYKSEAERMLKINRELASKLRTEIASKWENRDGD